MIIRKDAVFMAVASLLATAGFAMAGTPDLSAPVLTLDTAMTAPAPDLTPAPAATPAVAAEAPLPEDGLLMQGLDRVGVAKTLHDYGINIYGFIEGGYTYNHRHNTSNASGLIAPGPFNHEYGNHMMLNQFDLRFEKVIDGKKWDIGGMVELMYGTDAAQIHSSGMGFNGSDPTDNDRPRDSLAVDNLHPSLQFDVTQAYLDFGIPVGNGLKIRVGKFVTLLGYETIDPRGNNFYSHSYLFSMIPYTQTGILAFYQFNDQLSVIGGITRGWDQTLEDGNSSQSSCAIDFLGQVNYKFNNQWNLAVNLSVGPQNGGDTSHYRTVIDPILTWKATDKLTFAAETLYAYDGGRNGNGSDHTHAYGDTWGLALYGTYTFNDYVSTSLRLEKAHIDTGTLVDYSTDSSGIVNSSSSFINTNYYEVTLGCTVTPFPHDPIGKNLSVRPEIRYDYGEDKTFGNGTDRLFKDQLTFAADVIFKF